MKNQNTKKTVSKATQDRINSRIDAIMQAAASTGRTLTLKQAHQIEEKSQQLIWEGQRQSQRNNEIKAREIEAAFQWHESQNQMN